MIMDYIPDQIHENFQKEHFFLVNSDFAWTNCGPRRLNEMSDSKDWDETETIDLVKGDVISVRFFKSSPMSESYTYLEKVWSKGDMIEYKKETVISLALIEKNLDPGKFPNKSWLFSDAKKIIERERKLESLLC